MPSELGTFGCNRGRLGSSRLHFGYSVSELPRLSERAGEEWVPLQRISLPESLWKRCGSGGRGTRLFPLALPAFAREEDGAWDLARSAGVVCDGASR